MLLCLSAFAAKCPDCNGSGKVEVECKICKGTGVVSNTKVVKVKEHYSGYGFRPLGYKSSRQTISVNEPCRACLKGFVEPGARGTGVVKVKCKTCNGKGFILTKTPKPKTPNPKNN